MRAQIKAVMRYAGWRMFFRHPVLALLHMLDALLQAWQVTGPAFAGRQTVYAELGAERRRDATAAVIAGTGRLSYFAAATVIGVGAVVAWWSGL